jgi:hypothetical protein
MSDDQTLEELVQQRDLTSLIDLPQLNRAINRQAVLTVRWCLLFHRMDGVDVDPHNDPPTYAIGVDDRGLDFALQWLPAQLIRKAEQSGHRRVHLSDLNEYLAAPANSGTAPPGDE